MTQLGQSAELAQWRAPAPHRVPQPSSVSLIDSSDLERVVSARESASVGLVRAPEAIGGSALGALISLGARRARFQNVSMPIGSGPTEDSTLHLGMLVSAQLQVVPPVSVSEKAENFARNRGLWGSLIMLKSLILKGSHPFSSLNIDLVADPEIPGWFSICFTLRTSADLPDILHFDESIRGLVYDQLPLEDQTHFAVRFEFV